MSSRSESTARGSSRLYTLDLLRFIAALLVVSRHWLAVGSLGLGGPRIFPYGVTQLKQIEPEGVVHFATYGDLGVQLFFLISGFVICMSSWGRSVGQFGASRISRLFPAYWFAVVASVLVLLTFSKLGFHNSRGLPHDVLMNLTMTQSFYGVRDIDPVYWTLAAELRFYLIFAIVVAFGVTYRRVMYFCWLWVFVAMFGQMTGNGTLNAVVQPQYAPYFIAGVAFFLMWRFGPTLLLWGLVVVAFLTAQSQLRPDPAAFPEVGWSYPQWPMTVAILLFFGLMALVATHKLDWIRWAPLAPLGALTYPLYLLHQDIGFTLIAYLHEHLSFWPTVGIAAALILTLCYLVQRFVEKPAQRLLKNGMKHSLDAMRRADAESGSPSRRRPPLPRQDAASEAETRVEPRVEPLGELDSSLAH
ncbi:acyltransferase [Catenulispora yoronensis]|uniref:Acyltransferase n=1 Tax=Catenulispora yoronensis TaxID=450799 RepID=A0ABN2TLK1_9ACTN